MDARLSWIPTFHGLPAFFCRPIRSSTNLATSRFSLTRHLLASLMIASPSLGQMRLACQDGGASRESRLGSALKVERELICGSENHLLPAYYGDSIVIAQ